MASYDSTIYLRQLRDRQMISVFASTPLLEEMYEEFLQ